MVSASQREAERRAERIDRKAAAESSSALAKAAMGLGAAFLVYQRYGQRWLREQVASSPQPITRRRFVELANRLGAEGIDKFVLTAIPPLVSGYANGLKEAKIAQRNPAWIQKSAEHYANRLGEHIHNVSAEAMIDGFTTQLNRKVPARMAADRVIDAFGVAPKTMKALVNVWLGPAPKESPTALPLGNPIKERADKMIADAIANRANTIAVSESHTAKNQAKAVQWNWQHSRGQLPDTARVVWYTAKDERVCPTCAPMHGKIRKVNEQFRLPSGEHVWAPQVHPNCRCDVVLVQKVTQAALAMSLRQAQMLDEAREYVSVAKASNWEQENKPKRDQGGKFARVESRQRQPQRQTQQRPRMAVKERAPMDPGVANVLRETRAAQQAPAQAPVPVQAPPAPAPTELELPASVNLPAELDLPTELDLPANLDLPATVTPEEDLELPGEDLELPGAPLDLPGSELDLPGSELDLPQQSLEMPEMPEMSIPLPDVEELTLNKPDISAGNEKWVNTPGNRPMYAVFDDLAHRNGPDGYISDEAVSFYDSHGDPMAMEKALDEYWRGVYGGIPDVFVSDSFFNQKTGNLDYVATDGTTYQVSLDTYTDLFFWALNNSQDDAEVWIPVHRPGSAREMNLMDTSANTADEQVSAQFLATHLGIDQYIEDLTPTLGVAYHVNMESQGVTGSGAMTNPGNWRVIGGDPTTQMSNDHGQYYNLVYIEPEDL